MTKRLQRLAALAAALACAAPAPAADLSPAHWPAGERQALDRREAAIFPAAPRAVEGRTGLVAGTASPIAVRAGMEALRRGGSAADAAMATALVQVTDWLGANVSFAGVAQLVYYDARRRRVFAMDAGWNSWRGETDAASLPEADLSPLLGGPGRPSGAGGRKALVPGFVAGMEAMHRRFGRLPFADLFAPAIDQAEHGVRLTPLHAAWFAMARERLMATAEGRRFALGGASRPPAAGDLFVQPELAAFLRAVAAQGSRHVYRGTWARHFVAAVNRAGGHASLAELAAYRVRWSEPLATRFAGATVYAPGEPNRSACAGLEALNLIEHRAVSGAYWQDAASLRTLALAVRAGQLAAVAPDAAAAIEARLGLPAGGSCRARLTPGFGAAAAPRLAALAGLPGEAGHHSASVVTIDRWGNVAALVHSSNAPLWGETGLFVDGVPIPSPATVYRDLVARTPPGGRLPSDMAPMIALRRGRPVLAVASIGVSVVEEAVRLAATLLQGRTEPSAALAAPPLLLNVDQARDPAALRAELVPAGAYPAELLAAARAAGLETREVDRQKAEALRGTAVIGRLGADGRLASAEVPGVLAFAEAD